jgi:GR25 family glycosyltransferase involved in LPS biosynthesis
MGMDFMYGVGTASDLTVPQVYIIADCDPHSPHYRVSQRNLARTQAQAALHGWSTEVWPAVNGHAVTSEDWSRIGVKLLDRGAIVQRPGAQGCWFSHWGLWQHCVATNQPIVVLEHDAHVNDAWPENIDLEACVWKLYRPDGRGERINTITGEWSRGSWAYAITPKYAQQIIDFSRTHGAQALDKQLGRLAIPWQYWPTDLVTHSPAVCVSTTSPKTKHRRF